MSKEKDGLFDRDAAQGSAFDHLHFSDDELRQGTEINQMAAAGQISWDDAHNWWENTRARYGYSGGEDGHGYTTLANKAKENTPSYINQYQGAINQVANALMNRKAFTYDHNNDPMYQQYVDSYTRQGQKAMQDTLAQVSARTGGLASSYAGTAAQQTYNNYMSALADKVPELRQLAYQMYMDEGDTMRQNLQMLQGLEATEYGRYRDRVSDDKWQQEFDTQNSQWQQEFDTQNSQWQQDFDFEKGLTAASLLAQAGNYSGYKDLFGLSEDDMAALQAGHISEKDLQAAELLAQAGDFSGYQKIFNLSPEKVAKLEKAYQQQNAPKVTGGGGDTPAPAEGEIAGLFDSVPDEAITRIQSITNQDELATYLDGLEQSGVISQDTADALYATYLPNNELPDLSKRTWSVVDNGGTNWLWGVDNNAVVRDQYGNSYRLDALVDALVGHGMSSSEAKTYVKNLQKRLGI